MSVEIKPGDVIRLYGYPGTFVAGRREFRWREDCIEVQRGDATLWWSPVSSIVEINGSPVPMRSCPLGPPAPDYPHEPQFDYNDGPIAFGQEIVKSWNDRAAAGSQIATKP